MTVRFCTEGSLAAGERLAGWGAHPEKVLLVRWPKSKWRFSARVAENMPPEVEAAVTRAAEAGWRVNLIDRKGETPGRHRVHVGPGARSTEVATGDLAAVIDAVVRGGPALTRAGLRPESRMQILCCTHGKHDRCCAKWGFPLYKTLDRETRATGLAEAWEVTHIGGCRLSAGVLVLPSRRKYGRMRPEDVPAFLAAEAAGRPYLPCYRGAADLAPAAQAAEVAGLRHLAAAGIRGRATVERDTTTGRFRVLCGRAVAEVSVAPEEVRAHGNCNGLSSGSDITPRTGWRATVGTVSLPASREAAR
ncbi:sucrase ferredoxin [Histidinibacterium aquaticum]|uniref:Sucrase ferredoxin n=1 Tax=Histidinibacterium aquaticum TaxID=2613962 RepID=A0A5J5GIS5_9RHOB|nr:sucrase ferredoxin [Histidinibacterium aquaticum]KAA9008136.1 sucrase ferredoxin [Histidinibacterium aquaticum]